MQAYILLDTSNGLSSAIGIGYGIRTDIAIEGLPLRSLLSPHFAYENHSKSKDGVDCRWLVSKIQLPGV